MLFWIQNVLEIEQKKGYLLRVSSLLFPTNTTTSPTLAETIQLSETIKKGESITIDVNLILGNNFKVMGLLICNK